MLSNRLKTIASLVTTNSVIDVGCDHALLDIYLTKEKKAKCLAIDCNINVINKTIDSVKKQHLEKEITILLNDGLKGIDIKKNDTVVIAGMGTKTIIDILKNNHKSINELIIQTNKELPILRRKVVNLGFYIASEVVVFEKDIYYVIIKFKKGFKKYYYYEYSLGPLLLKKKDEITIDYFKYLKNKYQNILTKYPKKKIYQRLRLKQLINKINKV